MGPFYFPKSDLDKIEHMRRLIDEKRSSEAKGRGAGNGKELVHETTSGNDLNASASAWCVAYYYKCNIF